MRSILQFIGKRFLWMIATLWLVYTVSFILMRLAPGGPFSAERKVPPAVERQMEMRYNLDGTYVEQYFDYLGGILFRGDLGWSLRLEDYSVNEVIAQGFPVSASLAVFALLFAVALGVTAGVVSAVYRQTFADTSLMIAAVIGIAVPNFVLASVAILLFVFGISLFPAGGWGVVETGLAACLVPGSTRCRLHRSFGKNGNVGIPFQRACQNSVRKRAFKTLRDDATRLSRSDVASGVLFGTRNRSGVDRFARA